MGRKWLRRSSLLRLVILLPTVELTGVQSSHYKVPPPNPSLLSTSVLFPSHNLYYFLYLSPTIPPNPFVSRYQLVFPYLPHSHFFSRKFPIPLTPTYNISESSLREPLRDLLQKNEPSSRNRRPSLRGRLPPPPLRRLLLCPQTTCSPSRSTYPS